MPCGCPNRTVISNTGFAAASWRVEAAKSPQTRKQWVINSIWSLQKTCIEQVPRLPNALLPQTINHMGYCQDNEGGLGERDVGQISLKAPLQLWLLSVEESWFLQGRGRSPSPRPSARDRPYTLCRSWQSQPFSRLCVPQEERWQTSHFALDRWPSKLRN